MTLLHHTFNLYNIYKLELTLLWVDYIKRKIELKFTVTGKGAINLGLFVVHVDRANFTSASSANGNWWNAPMQQLDRFLCQDSTFAVPYTTISWTQTTSGFYDLIFFGYNSSYSDIDISVGIYNSSQPSFVGTGNSGSPASGCTSFHFPRSTSNRIDNFIYGVTGIQSDISAPFQSGFATSVALYIELRAGTSYTAVIGAYQASGRTGTFGMLSRPSIVGYLNNQKIFPTPIINGDGIFYILHISYKFELSPAMKADICNIGMQLDTLHRIVSIYFQEPPRISSECNVFTVDSI